MPLTTVNAGAFIHTAADALREAHPEECRLLAELLVSRALHCPRLELPLHYADGIPPETLPALRADLARLAKGLPWQYLAGTAGFLGRDFQCDRRALIPRPETELFVEWFLNSPMMRNASAPAVAEVGAGSGCIIITIALERPDARCRGLDISPDALELARENAARLDVAGRVSFMQNDLLAAWPDRSLDMLISNPPYVTTAEWQKLPIHIREFEPALALLAGDDGMRPAARLVPQAARALKPGGGLFLEFAPARLPQLRQCLQAAGFEEIETGNDYTGRPHFICGRCPRENHQASGASTEAPMNRMAGASARPI